MMRNSFAKVSDPNSFVTSPGDRFHVNFQPIIAKDGTIDLKPVGKDDIQAYIDSFRDSTDMAYIIQRLQLGDTSVLSSKVPYFGDFTSFPTTYAEVLQVVMDGEAQFNKLPLDVRNSFDNDFRKWFAVAGSDEWLSKMSPVLPQEEIKVDEVISDES